MQVWINIHGILLYQLACRLIIPLALDSLNLGKEFSEEMTELPVIIHLHIGAGGYDISLSILQGILGRSIAYFFRNQFHGSLGMLQGPPGNEGTVSHVRLLNLIPLLDSDGLGEQTVHQITVILRLESFIIRSQSQLNQLMISHIVQAEEIGPRLLYRIAIRLQGIRISARKKLTATMSQTLVKVGMQVIGDISILVHQRHSLLIDDKLISESVALSRLVVGICQVADGNALRTVLLADPVGIRQIDADSRSRIFLSAEHRRTDHVGSNAFDLRFSETGIHRRMILKPLCILTDGLGALGSLQVLIFHDSLPGSFQTEWVAIYLDESVDEIHHTFVLLYPGDTVSVEILEITGAIELHEQVDDMLLSLILSEFLRLEQPGNDFLDRLAIESILLPHQLNHLVVALGELGVESVRWRCRVRRILQSGIESLHFRLGHILIEIAGRGLYQVFAIGLVHSLRHHLRVEDDRHKLSEEIFLALSSLEGQLILRDFLHQLIEEFLRESRLEFLAAIMMMDAAGKPYALQIYFESLEFFGIAYRRSFDLSSRIACCLCVFDSLSADSLVMAIDCLQGFANAQVVLSLLVERDVTSHQGSLCQAVNIQFLIERQCIESLQLVTQHLDVGKALVGVYITICHVLNLYF